MSSPLAARIEALEGDMRALRTALDAFTARRSPGPRDHADVALVAVLTTSTRGLSFTTAAVWRHRAVDVALSAALEQADIDSPKQLGRLLRRLEGRTVDGVRIARVGVNREGIIWACEFEQE